MRRHLHVLGGILAGVVCLGSVEPADPGGIVEGILDLSLTPPAWEQHVDPALMPLLLGSPRDVADVPGDGASLAVLLAFWSRVAEIRTDLEPSATSRERLLDAVEARPETLHILLKCLPDNPPAHDRVKRLLETAPSLRRNVNARVRVLAWLMRRSRYFRSELINAATQAVDADGAVRGREELEALARLDWHAAGPILKAHALGAQPRVAALSLALMYRNAIETGRWERVGEVRERLQGIAEDRQASGRTRSEAIDVLMRSGWAGRNDWFLSLLEDETLRRLHDGLFVLTPLQDVVTRSPQFWIPLVASRIGDPNRTVHDSAVACLAHFHLKRARRDALLPLVPWIDDPAWSSAGTGWSPGYRLRILQSLDEIDVPESVPGLIRVVREEGGLYREAAAKALGRYCARASYPALREAFRVEPEERRRRATIRALQKCGALTDQEVAKAILALARRAVMPKGMEEIERVRAQRRNLRLSDEVSLGLMFLDEFSPSDDAAARVLKRLDRLERENPEAARFIAGTARNWEGESVRSWMLERIESGRGEALDLVPLLSKREEVAIHHARTLERWEEAGGTLAGFAAVLVADDEARLALLDGSDPQALAAMLAAAAIAREPIPVDRVGDWLLERGTLLGRAARRYLESDDSEEARDLVRAHMPGAPIILGFRPPPPHTNSAIRDMTFEVWESLLREEVLRDGGPNEVHALLSRYLIHDVAVPNAGGEHLILKIWNTHATLTIHREGEGEIEHEIPLEEAQEFKKALEEKGVAALPALVVPQITGPEYEYLRLDRSSGRRVLIRAFEGGTVGSAYGSLKEAFRDLRDAAPQG